MKRKKLIPNADLREGWAERALPQTLEAEERDEEEEGTPLVRRERRADAPRRGGRPTQVLRPLLKRRRYVVLHVHVF